MPEHARATHLSGSPGSAPTGSDAKFPNKLNCGSLKVGEEEVGGLERQDSVEGTRLAHDRPSFHLQHHLVPQALPRALLGVTQKLKRERDGDRA